MLRINLGTPRERSGSEVNSVANAEAKRTAVFVNVVRHHITPVARLRRPSMHRLAHRPHNSPTPTRPSPGPRSALSIEPLLAQFRAELRDSTPREASFYWKR